MKYSPITESDQQTILETLKVKNFSALIEDMPKMPDIPFIQDHSEIETQRHFESLFSKNISGKKIFLGAGAYNHYIPSAINQLAERSEFYTAYTPYQPEISQGTLSVIFEFQSYICSLTGLDIANASLYDGATATAEAAIMSVSATGRKKIVAADTLHPNYLEVLKTYLHVRDIDLDIVDLFNHNIDSATAGIIYACPDFFGTINDYTTLISKAHNAGALFISVVDPISLSILEAPGKLSADIVVGEGQALGLPLSFGGPYLGFMSTKKDFLRTMPGRIVGATEDIDGKRAFVLTFQTREQHIRREKATSNICSNQALCALRATIYLSIMGDTGLKAVAQTCMKNIEYLKHELNAIPGFSADMNAISLKEAVIQTPVPVHVLNQKLLAENNMIGGLDLSLFFPEKSNQMLICSTEIHSQQDLLNFVKTCKQFALAT